MFVVDHVNRATGEASKTRESLQYVARRQMSLKSKKAANEQLQGSFIGDFANVSNRITSIYLTFLGTPELIMMCRA